MLLNAPPTDRSIRVGFLPVPGYSAISMSCALEPLRMANQLTERVLYDWQVITLGGQPIAASNGLVLAPAAALEDKPGLDMLFVCGGVDIKKTCDKRILAWLRRLAAHEVVLGGVCTGAYILARAGVLEGYRCTLHWENISSINEQTEFPKTYFSSELFVIDRDRCTCSGGIAPLDMMLNIISRQMGQELAEGVSEEFVHERMRGVRDMQRIPLRAHLGTGHPRLLTAVTLMEANIEEPLTLDELAGYVKVSRRQLERLFRKYLDRAPTRYYLELRLKRAREFLLQTDLSIIDIALACGFASSPHFSKCYHDYFGRPPSRERGVHRNAHRSPEATADPMKAAKIRLGS